MDREHEKLNRLALQYSCGPATFKERLGGCVLCRCKSSELGMHEASDGEIYCGYCYESIQTVGIKDRAPLPRDENDEV